MLKKVMKYKYLLIILFIIIIAIIYILLKGGDEMNLEVNLDVSSSAFKNGDTIPIKYTGQGEDISIPLEFNDVVSSGKSITIIMDDPDAPFGTFTHWLIWNIPATLKSINENYPHEQIIPLMNIVQGKNDFGTVGYKGPNPPSGTHTYQIKVYVLDCRLDYDYDASKEDLEKTMEGHILQYGLLEGKFSKEK
jgi:Raf kinase inhibitor-like YbhB/YbcL family protein